jgi:hypothetical protein
MKRLVSDVDFDNDFLSARRCWFIPVILITQEAEIRRIAA